MDGGGDLLSLAFPGQQPLEHADEPGQGSTPFNGAVVLKPAVYEGLPWRIPAEMHAAATPVCRLLEPA
jgi:hypothetical protein